jgi:hypothetical protein
LSDLGLDKNEALRSEVQGLATRTKDVDTANEEMRWIYFGVPMLEAQKREGAVKLIQRTLTPEQRTSADAAKEEERARIIKQLNMQVRIGDRIHFTKNSRLIFKARNEQEEDHEVNLYNSRMLEAVQFYDAPKRIVGNLHCRCGLCPPKPDNAPRDFMSPCMVRLDLVPPRRCQRALRSEANADRYFEYHDERLSRRNPDGRRMAVLREETGNYIEVDVMRQMKPNSRWRHGFFTTTHKMQGSQQKCIIYVITEAACWINWKFLYTAATRAQERLIILSTDEVFDQLVRRKEPVRNSMLWYLLFDEMRSVLRQYPSSACAQRARAVCPHMFDDDVIASDQRWAVFELVRYRTDVPRPTPAVAPSDDDDDGNVESVFEEENDDSQPAGLYLSDTDEEGTPAVTSATPATHKRSWNMMDVFCKRAKN